jgi:hypothetical protein
MHTMSAAERTFHARAMVVERAVVAEELLDEHTRIEPFLMLEDDSGHTRVRKLTLLEKIAHSERTGATVFMADDREHEEFWALLDSRADDQ